MGVSADVSESGSSDRHLAASAVLLSERLIPKGFCIFILHPSSFIVHPSTFILHLFWSALLCQSGFSLLPESFQLSQGVI